eukprot:5064882-Amphidinium_carterae.1
MQCTRVLQQRSRRSHRLALEAKHPSLLQPLAALHRQAVAEFYRVLRPGGIFVSMTFGMPQSRADLRNEASVLCAKH